MKLLAYLTGLLALACAAPAAAQTGTSVQFPSGWAPSTSICSKQADGTCVPVGPGAPLQTADPDAGACTTGSGTAVGTVLVQCDTLGYRMAVVQANPAATGGTIAFEQSNDAASWMATQTYVEASSTFTSATVLNGSAGVYRWPAGARYFRVRVTAAVTGTPAFVAVMRQLNIDSPSATTLAASSAAIGITYSNLSSNTTYSPAAYGNLRYTSIAGTNGTLVSASARRLVAGQIYNASTSVRYVSFYNKSTAPIVGTDTPFVTIAVMPNSVLSISGVIGNYGAAVISGLGFGVTGGFADTDTTAIGAGEVTLSLLYL